MLEVKWETVANSKILLRFIMLNLLIIHAISGLGRTGVSFITSVI